MTSVLPGPWVEGVEENLVGAQDVAIFQVLLAREVFEGGIQSESERGVLKPPNDLRVFFTLDVAQIAARREVATKRIKGHDLASRK
jgi:hypothetical protein